MHPISPWSPFLPQLERQVRPFSFRVTQDHPSVFCGPSGNVVERVLPEGHHAVKFVAVYDKAMAAGLSDHVWSLKEIVMMAENYMPKPGKRGPYKRQVA